MPEVMPQAYGEMIRYEEDNAPPSAPRIMLTSCTTQQQNCAGVATFINQDGGQPWSFRVWFGNGAHGQSNFVLPPRQTHGLHVQTGDTYSSASGGNGVPDNAQRYWINVA